MAASRPTQLRLVQTVSDAKTKTAPTLSSVFPEVGAITKEDIEEIKKTQHEILRVTKQQIKRDNFTNTLSFGNYLTTDPVLYQSVLPSGNDSYVLKSSLFSRGLEYSYIPKMNKIDETEQPVGIPVYIIAELGSAILGIISLISLIIWGLTAFQLINPILSLIGLVGSPFFYLMGRISRKQLLEGSLGNT